VGERVGREPGSGDAHGHAERHVLAGVELAERRRDHRRREARVHEWFVDRVALVREREAAEHQRRRHAGSNAGQDLRGLALLLGMRATGRQHKTATTIGHRTAHL